jgi:hypothetical protein
VFTGAAGVGLAPETGAGLIKNWARLPHTALINWLLKMYKNITLCKF